jgi:formate dehydrogenase iron-sulfur subunit
MKDLNRRNFLKASAGIVAGSALIKPETIKAAPQYTLSNDREGVLVDTTVCIGCRNCEFACKGANELPAGNIDSYADRSVFKKMRRPTNQSLTVVNEYHNPKNHYLPINVKVQCMHCDHPACVSACIVGAFSKEENGSVVWDTDKCIGCRYCMVACPFQVPTFDYEKAIEPNIRKCTFCFERRKDGHLPACVETCPTEALLFGKRNELIEIARDRISRHPDKYVNHLYGEKEAGGTGWLYLTGVQAQQLDFPALPEKPVPGVSEAIQHGIFAYFVPPVALYALLGGMMYMSKKRQENNLE